MLKFSIQTDKRPTSRGWRWFALGLILLLVLAGVLALEHWRGRRALASGKARMAERGEDFSPSTYFPEPTAETRKQSRQLANLSHQLSSALVGQAGQLQGTISGVDGRVRRGSQEAFLSQGSEPGNPVSWSQLEKMLQEAQPTLEAIRSVLKEPSRGVDTSFQELIQSPASTSLAGHRQIAQSFRAAALVHLRRHDLEAVLADVESLTDLMEYRGENVTLLAYMIRIAVTGLSMDVAWDALQEPGWTEPQLQRWESLLRRHDTLERLPRAIQAERTLLVGQMEHLAGIGYRTWLDRQRDLGRSFGLKLSEKDDSPRVTAFRQWVFHPLWSYAWREQEELRLLRHMELQLAAVRRAIKDKSARVAELELTRLQQNYRPPPEAWRYYGRLPGLDLNEVVGTAPGSRNSNYPYPVWNPVLRAVMKNLGQVEMARTQVALKRFHLRSAKWPERLSELVPDFLPGLPRDYQDGQPLRYRAKPDGLVLLYSVGEDLLDNDGDGRPNTPNKPSFSHFDGKDWLWPVAGEAIGTNTTARPAGKTITIRAKK